MKWIAIFSALALAGCESQTELNQRAAALEAQQDSTCRSWGAQPGTEAYTNCRVQLAQMEEQRRAAVLQAYQANRANRQPALEPPTQTRLPETTRCTSQRIGNQVETVCR
jgi:hypothetical protein